LGAKMQAYLEKKIGITVSLVQRFLHQSYVLSDQSTKQAKDLTVGDMIDARVGDTLAFDAKVLDCAPGTTALDHFQDGGFLPRDLKVGQLVAAGTKLHSGAVQLVVTKALRQSRFADMDRSIKEFESLQKKASILGRAEDWLQWFIPALLLFALAAFLVLSTLYSVAIGVQAVTAILVSACPCTLGLIIPMALRMGAFKASSQQLYFKSSKALETAAKTDILVLDYNGSLTLGQPEMTDFQASEPALAQSIIKAFEARMLAERPGQVIGMAIAKAVEASPLMQMDDFCWVTGGVRGVTATGTFWFGNDELLRHLGIAHGQRPHTYYLVNQAQQIEASFVMRDQPRPGVKQLIQRLLAKGRQVKVCTGADASTTEEILSTLNIGAEHLVTNCKPEQKKAYIEALSQANPGKMIAMLGDGLNDRKALEAAHLRIWVKHQQLSAEYQPLMQNIADLELSGDHLPHLDAAFDIASQTFALIQQNLCLSLVYNLVILTCACGALCMLPPALGVGLMMLQSLLLSLNTYRVLLQSGPKSETISNIDFQHA